MRVVTAVIALVLVPSVAGCDIFQNEKTVVKPDETACGCGDIRLMLDRQRLAKAAIQSIDKLMNAQTAKNPGEMYSDKLYLEARIINQARVSIASEGDEYTGSGHTPPVNCKPDVSRGQGDCMKASLQAHENVHQRECLKYDAVFTNYKNAKTMVDFWKEDREGYQAEVDYLERQIKRVVPECMHASYPGSGSKQDQQQRLAGSKRRVSKYVAGLS